MVFATSHTNSLGRVGKPPRLAIADGASYYPSYFSRGEQEALLLELDAILAVSPLFTPKMPKTGKEFSVKMSNCGDLGWVSDIRGYRYQAHHPSNNEPWQAIPSVLNDLWQDLSEFPGLAEACLINRYEHSAKMGLHQDRDEEEFAAPVISVSLGASCLFRYGGLLRGDKTQSLKLNSGDVLVFGGASRLMFHGVDRLYKGTSTLIKDDARINLTLRRVTKMSQVTKI